MRVIFLVLGILVLTLTSKTVSANAILLNEIMANPVSGEKEWVEIYNSSSENKDLTGWNLQEKTSSGTFNSYALPNVILQAKILCFYEFSTAKLNNDSDTVNLLDNTGALQDAYSYTSTTQGKSFARIPDGGNWNIDVTPTKISVCSSLTEPTPSPTTPNPTPSPTSSSSNSQSSSFTISNIPSQINSDQSFNVAVSLTLPNNRNTDYYLSGAFKKVDGTRYFGLTKINSNWVKYESSNYLNQYKVTTDENGNWTGTLEVKPDTADSDYKGTGDYIFKVSKYTANGSQAWSDESTIKIISTTTEASENSTDATSPTTKPSNSNSPSSVKKTSSAGKSKSYDTPILNNASIAGATTASAKVTTPSAEVEVKNQKQTNPIVWIGLIFIFAGASTLGYIYLRKNAKIPIPFGK